MRPLIFLILLLLHSSPLYSAEPPYTPPHGKTLLFIGQDNDTIETYLKEIGRMPDGFMVYSSIHEARSLDVSEDYGAGKCYANGLLRKHPRAMLQVGLYMVGSLDKVINGEYDNNIERIGRWIKKARVPIFLRIGYEFDLPSNYYDPPKYIQAYRYIVARLSQRF